MRKINHIIRLLLPIVAAAGICLSYTACEPEGLTDKTEFALYYSDITDIGPSTPMNLSPDYVGAKPSDFTITKVTLDGEVYESECFTINAESGTFSMNGTENLPVGLYKVSISCKAGGKTWNFADIISINMMKTIPEGITVSPQNEFVVRITDITDPSDESAELPEAKIVTEGGHISIKEYRIAGVRRDGEAIPAAEFNSLFNLSKEGVFTIKPGNKDFVPGVYVIDFRLVTLVVDAEAEEGIFANALTINVTSSPRSLTYAPAEELVEAGKPWTTSDPVLVGSRDGLEFSFADVKKSTADAEAVSIKNDATLMAFLELNPTTGAVTIKEGSTFAIGDKLIFDIKVKNNLGDITVERALIFDIVAFVEPIEGFAYAPLTVVQMQAIAQSKNTDGFKGSMVTYSFVDLAETLAPYLTIDAETGDISAARNHEIPMNEYTVKVKAENRKGAVETEFKLTVAENPNYFTFVHCGNNLGLGKTAEEIRSYPAQYRIDFDAVKTLEVTPVTDAKTGVTVNYTIGLADAAYEKSDKFWLQNTDKHKVENGKLVFDFTGAKRNIQVAKITATAGEGETSVTRESLIFVHLSQSLTNASQPKYRVDFTPFVMRVNPKTGASLDKTTVKVNNAAAPAGFTIDYRGDFRYANLNGPASHIDGRPADKSNTTFMYAMLLKFYTAIGNPDALNTGSKDALSYFNRGDKLSAKPLYVDNGDGYNIKVNPNIWRNDDGWANGLFIGQMNMGEAEGKDPSTNFGQPRPFLCVVWFDEKF